VRIVPLGKIAEIERKSVQPEEIQSGTLYVGLENISNGGKFENVATVENGELNSSKFQFNSSHILYGKLRPYLSKIALPSFEGICSTDILPIKPGPEVDKRFLFYFLRQPEMIDLATARSTGVNLPRLSPKQLIEFEIPLPPLAEQQRIAAILDKADALRAKRRAALAKLDILLQSTFLDMFGDPVTNPKGWKRIKLRLLSKRVVVGHVGPTSHGYVESGIPFLRTQNVRPNRINLNDLKYIKPDFHDKLKKSQLHMGDVLISRVGVNRGMSAVIPRELGGANCANVLIVTPGPKLISEYLAYLVNTTAGQRDLLSVSVGSAQGVINTNKAKVWPVLLPPVDLQNRFKEILIKVNQSRLQMKKAESCEDILFHSLQQRAFKGEL
jgi:type I restriction enzyme S subunit